jgi:hypothetical protein
MKDPMKGASKRVGIAVIATMNPAVDELPDNSSAIQGIAM